MPMKTILAAGVTALATITIMSGCTSAQTTGADKQEGAELAEQLIFNGGFRLDEEVQEGGTVRDRLTQDELQKACSGKERPGKESLTKVQTMARESYQPPDGDIELGNWEKGAELARSGYGFRVGHKADDHTKKEPGGNCYACHRISPDEPVYGTLSPLSLEGFGKARGNTPETRQYVHQVISNPHTVFPCTKMPRFGEQDILTEEQISHIMAYLLDPESPVNQ